MAPIPARHTLDTSDYLWLHHPWPLGALIRRPPEQHPHPHGHPPGCRRRHPRRSGSGNAEAVPDPSVRLFAKPNTTHDT